MGMFAINVVLMKLLEVLATSSMLQRLIRCFLVSSSHGS